MSWIIFIGLAGAMLALEAVGSLTPARHSLGRRWLSNTSIYVLGLVLQGLAAPASATAGAVLAAERGWGFFNLVDAPATIAVVATFLLLDALGYFSHRVEHALPLLWRMHRTHHSDPDLDVTTGLRFHPFESLWRGAATWAAVVLLGPSVEIAASVSMVIGLMSLASHVNAPLVPVQVEKWLQAVLVTPRVHRIHHSTDLSEAHSNYGVALSIWDRMLGTYRPEPNVPFVDMRFGLHDRNIEESLSIGKILADPLHA
jgi:sterol desaturase/sphingolipid hydroxylase (fatty acid hydroxylase superfamily)